MAWAIFDGRGMTVDGGDTDWEVGGGRNCSAVVLTVFETSMAAITSSQSTSSSSTRSDSWVEQVPVVVNMVDVLCDGISEVSPGAL